MWAYIFTFLSMLVTDIVYTQLLKSVQNDKPYLHRHWHEEKHHALLSAFGNRVVEK